MTIVEMKDPRDTQVANPIEYRMEAKSLYRLGCINGTIRLYCLRR